MYDTRVLSPALMLGAADTFSLEHLSAWSQLSLACVFHMFVGWGLSSLCGQLCGLHPSERRMVTLACTFQNQGGLPFVFITSLSHSWGKISGDPGALQRGFGMVLVYSLPWNILLYSVGLPLVRAHVDDEQASYCTPGPLHGLKDAAPSCGDEDAAICMQIVPPAMEIGVPSEEAADVLETPGDAQAAEVSASRPCRALCSEAFVTWVTAPPTIALLLAIAVGSSPLQKAFFGPSAVLGVLPAAFQTLGLASVPVNIMMLAANLSRAGGLSQTPASSESRSVGANLGHLRLTGRAQLVAFAVKLVLVPLVCTGCSILLLLNGALGKPSDLDPLFVLVLLIEPAMPSAQNLVMLYQVEGHSDAATKLSSAYLPQYVGSVVTMSFWVLVTLATIESLV
ncbi:unnamed protein product [Polarella glacialis]|uniref:Uncharacterized protein n=1 Tax=Polarella glacialis TaxID=89957 RepID=A0A813HGN8_POLGL|nr:unnamed protein product [Polarella glacialis]